MHPETHLQLYRMEHAARARALRRTGPPTDVARAPRRRDRSARWSLLPRRALAHR